MGIVNVSTTETKWTWLQKRLAGAQAQVDALAGQIQGLENTELNSDGSSTTCLTCGVNMHTEADFAKHYIVPDPRYLNIGYCPHNKVVEETNLDAAHANRVARQERTYDDVLGPMKDILHPDGF
jgi:hypothetical protein